MDFGQAIHLWRGRVSGSQCLLYSLSLTVVTLVLYAVDKDLRGRNILQSVVIDSATYLLTISSPDIDNVAMSLYDIIKISNILQIL